jgi:hypothetical protein
MGEAETTPAEAQSGGRSAQIAAGDPDAVTARPA